MGNELDYASIVNLMNEVYNMYVVYDVWLCACMLDK